MTAMLIWDLAGWVGAAFVLSGYAMVSMAGSPKTFHHVINLVGGLLLLGASAVKDAWFSVALNAAWIVIALVALLRLVIRKK